MDLGSPLILRSFNSFGFFARAIQINNISSPSISFFDALFTGVTRVIEGFPCRPNIAAEYFLS